MNEEKYQRISEWFRKKENYLKAFHIIYRILPAVTMAAYAGMVWYALFCYDAQEIIRVIGVPLITFILCTVMRYAVNEKRPYETMHINPLIKKDKKGQSFPSRHVLSASIIAMCGFYVNIGVGIVLMIISVVIAIIRPVAGVHYIKDVIAGLLLGIVCGLLGFWVI